MPSAGQGEPRSTRHRASRGSFSSEPGSFSPEHDSFPAERDTRPSLAWLFFLGARHFFGRAWLCRVGSRFFPGEAGLSLALAPGCRRRHGVCPRSRAGRAPTQRRPFALPLGFMVSLPGCGPIDRAPPGATWFPLDRGQHPADGRTHTAAVNMDGMGMGMGRPKSRGSRRYGWLHADQPGSLRFHPGADG